VAQASPTPFGGPPPEPGFIMPRTGFLGWIAEQQRQFYQAMTAALGALKQDNNAIWVLGSLSFLYGVFHAAGPGHGKVVISSYVLANERQVRRGVLLSFLSAMLQAAVAIALVLVAAAALNLTAAAMNEAAGWISVVSYALIALLGLWLIARKLFQRRDHGEHHHHHHHGHDHSHEHGHHVVTPEATRGSWREQLGVVLAVGLRPCSGALVVLAFALSQGVVLAGIVAVLLMAIGTALTVAVLASLAVGLKGFALNAGGGGAVAANLVWWAELVGAVLIFGFGAMLLVASF
jgi:nickel/cobalt transporter (NicO) family protein